MKLTSLLQLIVNKLQQVGKIDNLQQVCGVAETRVNQFVSDCECIIENRILTCYFPVQRASKLKNVLPPIPQTTNANLEYNRRPRKLAPITEGQKLPYIYDYESARKRWAKKREWEERNLGNVEKFRKEN